MRLFARTPEAAPAAPAPMQRARRNSVTCAALNAAIAAVCAEMDDCTARQTLETLYTLTDDAADGDLVKLDGPAPVTLALLDDALARAPELELPAGTVTPLTRVRELIAQAEKQVVAVAGEPVTRAELQAAVDAIGIAIREAAEGSRDAFFSMQRFHSRLDTIAERASPDVNRFLKRLLGAMRAESSGQYGADRGRPQVFSGAGGRNF